MELRLHDIIRGIVLTPKSTDLFKKYGKVTLTIDRAANKLTVRKAVEKIWDVKVDSVRVITVPGKRKRVRGKMTQSPGKKKAVITLKKGFKINLPEHFEATEQLLAQRAAKPEAEGK